MANQCAATTQAGKPCAATPRPGRTLCAWHSPDFAEQRRTWSAKGGANKSNKARASRDLADAGLTMPEVGGLLSGALKKVADGTMEPGVGTALATLARAIVAVQEAGALEDRLSQLEVRAGLGTG
jgi:hypothetical protein